VLRTSISQLDTESGYQCTVIPTKIPNLVNQFSEVFYLET
jgi:hypothetical protein